MTTQLVTLSPSLPDPQGGSGKEPLGRTKAKWGQRTGLIEKLETTQSERNPCPRRFAQQDAVLPGVLSRPWQRLKMHFILIFGYYPDAFFFFKVTL